MAMMNPDDQVYDDENVHMHVLEHGVIVDISADYRSIRIIYSDGFTEYIERKYEEEI